MTRSRWTRTALAALAVLLLVVEGPTAAAQAPAEPAQRPGRLLVVSLPGLTWSRLEALDVPAIEEVLADAALADLAPRSVRARSTPGDAYLTISAGSRSRGQTGVDGQVMALDEQSSGSAAGDIYRRRNGSVPDGGYVALAWPALVRANANEPYDAELGLLRATLEGAGVSSAVIANADGTDSIGASYERQAGLALADPNGVVAEGTLTKDLVVEDPGRPFGRRLDLDAVVGAFRAEWAAARPTGDRAGGVVLVEASDLARTLRYRPFVGAARYRELYDTALREADGLVASLLEDVGPDDSVLVVAPYARGGDRDLTVVGLRRPGSTGGYLTSASTQRSGFVTLVDLAPTILDTFGIARPVGMEGRPAEVVRSGAGYEQRVDRLVSLNAASRFRERLLVPTTMVVVLGMVLVAALTAVLVVTGRAARWRRVASAGPLFVLGLLPASYLARAFPLEDLGIGFYWAFVLGTGAVVAVVLTVLEARTGRARLALVTALALVAAVPVLDVVTGSNLSLSAAFGYSPTGNSRLYGISNYSYGQVAAAVCLLAGVLIGRSGTRPRLLAIGLLGATLVVLGVPVWGSDVGGVLAFTPSIGLFVVLVLGWRLRLRTLLVGGVATGLAITAFGLLDLSRPPEQRAHLGRLFERVGDEGLRPLIDVMERKLLANLSVSTSSFWVLAIPVALGFWAFVTRYPLDPGRAVDGVRREVPGVGPAFATAVTAAVLGSLVNDSGAIVGGVAATVLVAATCHLLLRDLLGRRAPS